MNTSPTESSVASPWNHGKLRVNSSGRYLEHGDGTPFLWIGDTGWDIFQKLKSTDLGTYFQNRKQRGFTVIQCVLVGESEGPTKPCSENGCAPFSNSDPDHPVEEYWRWVDSVIAKAAEFGLYLVLLPAWGQWVCGRIKNSDRSMVIFNTENAYRYGLFLGKRYGKKRNLIWMLGGDRAPSPDDRLVYERKAAGIREHAPDHLITFHPLGSRSSSEFFQSAGWCNFNTYQSGHGFDRDLVHVLAMKDWNESPVKPTLNSEPAYETICSDLTAGNPRISAYDNRKDAWRSITSGTCGHTYGHASISQFLLPGEVPKYTGDPLIPWYKAILSDGSAHIGLVGKLLKSRPVYRESDESLVSGGLGDGASRMGACRGKDFALVYFPSCLARTINFGKISGEKVTCWWYDTTDGTSKEIGQFANSKSRSFTPPGEKDCLLVIDNSEKKFDPPGVVDIWYNFIPTATG